MVNLANGFIAAGIKVDILVNAKPHTPLSYVPLDPKINVINHGYHKYQAFGSLLRYLKEQKPTALLTAGHRYNTMGAWANKISKADTKIFLSMHENLSASCKRLGPFKQAFRHYSVRSLFAQTNGVISVSQGVGDDLVRLGLPPNKSQVIYNPIADDQLIAQSKAAIDHPWFTTKTHPIILGVGRLEEQKDYPTLIKAFAVVHKQLDAKLVILGEGRERATLQTLINELKLQDAITLLGHVDNPFSYMKQSDLFVLSSVREGFGNVIAEALAIGCPVVSTDCPSGPNEILANGQFGMLVPMQSPEALGQAILSTLKAPLPSDTLRQRGSTFSVSSSVQHYLDYML